MRTMPSPQTTVRLARLLFPGQPIDEGTIALTLEWLEQCKDLATINGATESSANGEWYGRSSENGSSAHPIEERPLEPTTKKEGDYTEEDPQLIIKDFRAYVKKNRLPASKVSKELGVHVASIYSWLGGRNTPRDEHLVTIQKYLARALSA